MKIFTFFFSIQQTNEADFGYGVDEDIYEALETDIVEDKPPSLPPLNAPKPTIPTGKIV